MSSCVAKAQSYLDSPFPIDISCKGPECGDYYQTQLSGTDAAIVLGLFFGMMLLIIVLGIVFGRRGPGFYGRRRALVFRPAFRPRRRPLVVVR